MSETHPEICEVDSDLEMEGIDQEGDDEEEQMDVQNPIEGGTEQVSGSKKRDEEKYKATDADVDQNEKEVQENKELEAMMETDKERAELLAAQRKSLDMDAKTETSSDRFQYLLSQSEVFAHFLSGSVATKTKSKSKKSSSSSTTNSTSRKKGRLTEAEEDAHMLQSAQSKIRTIRVEKQPSILSPQCKMHDYQLEGLNWLIKLHDHGINGILADEMGLGKTLQTISLLAYLRESRGVKGPHLCIVPKSVVGNWIREIKKWCPEIRAVRMGGTKDERKSVVRDELTGGKAKHLDVLVTSYEGILKEKGVLNKIAWKYLIIDEAHRIKNENSSLSKVVRTISTQHRLLITGTPLQNNLHELWALLNFLLPDIFNDAEQFDEWFCMSGEKGQENVIKKLHTVLRPFMIRRVKKDVACGLPPKKETKLYVGLTTLQQEWYKRILRKDAHELNSLGGPDRVRLLNVLMQLRKVCNHPYLFDGAEPGPPYTDGPHLWESSGKMLLLHKLLLKLKQKGSRVLIFSQMTRVLDIMEDYLRLTAYGYCRIDGNTSGEQRDSQMDVFNAPNSEKFVFLLSTRAGGLGINLATADIVILFDSDWNPQVDLQAMDRAHRIGQTKPVQVFRFLAEGTVEEKIIERADRKLFLDAAVIQQGRLAEQNQSVNKDDLMKMVKFGADQILNGKGGSYTDEDIDALIAKGEEKTTAMQAKLKTDAQHNLASFSLLGDEGGDTFDFGGENYRDSKKKSQGGNFINLPQRERKRNYDVNEYFRETMNAGGTGGGRGAPDSATKKRKKGPNHQDFQLYDKEALEVFNTREKELAAQREKMVLQLNQLKESAKLAPSLQNSRANIAAGSSREELSQQVEKMEKTLQNYSMSPEELEQKKKVLAEAFPDWSRKDFKSFCSSLERHGRFDVVNVVKDVVNECGKSESEVKRYFVSFWLNYRRISDWKKIIDKIQKGEKKILRLRQIRDAIHEKVELHIDASFSHGDPFQGESPSSADLLDYCWQTIKLQYGPGTKNRAYAEEEDAFLLCMMHRHGYGAVERIRIEIRSAPQFRFDWYFKSRNSNEIQKRCDAIVKMVEKEIEEIRKREEEEDIKKRRSDEEKKRSTEDEKNRLGKEAIATKDKQSQKKNADYTCDVTMREVFVGGK